MNKGTYSMYAIREASPIRILVHNNLVHPPAQSLLVHPPAQSLKHEEMKWFSLNIPLWFQIYAIH
jgi:hypothetical protein